MALKGRLTQTDYERFCGQVEAGAKLCSDVQLLALASQINNQLRRRRAGLDPRSFATAISGSPLDLS